MVKELKQELEKQMIATIDTRRRFVMQIVMDDPEYDVKAHAAFLIQQEIPVEDVEHDMHAALQLKQAIDYEESIPQHEAEISAATEELDRISIVLAEVNLSLANCKNSEERKKLEGRLQANSWDGQKATQRLDSARQMLASAQQEIKRLERLQDPLSSLPSPGCYILTPRSKKYGADGREIPPFGTGLCQSRPGHIHTAQGIGYRN